MRISKLLKQVQPHRERPECNNIHRGDKGQGKTNTKSPLILSDRLYPMVIVFHHDVSGLFQDDNASSKGHEVSLGGFVSMM